MSLGLQEQDNQNLRFCSRIYKHSHNEVQNWYSDVRVPSVFYTAVLGNYLIQDLLPFPTHMDTHKGTVGNRTGLPASHKQDGRFPKNCTQGQRKPRMENVLKKKKSTNRYLTLTSTVGTGEKRNKDLVTQTTLKQTHVQH